MCLCMGKVALLVGSQNVKIPSLKGTGGSIFFLINHGNERDEYFKINVGRDFLAAQSWFTKGTICGAYRFMCHNIMFLYG
jgi:hypothetical protein